MSAERDKRMVRIFVAAPADMATERAKVVTVCDALRALAAHVGVALEVLHWRHVEPDLARPLQSLYDQLQPTAWDVFIGIVWHRFGTPQSEGVSGTEEEFDTAYRLWRQFNRPRLLLYRCTRSVSLDALDPEQFKHVKEFFDRLGDVGYRTFDTPEAFEKLLFEDAQGLLVAYSEAEQGHPVSPQTISAMAPQTLVPQRYANTLPQRTAFFGRHREMEMVLRALSLEDRSWGVVIDGIGGIGKTALAVEAAYRCKERNWFDAFIFISAKQRSLEVSGVTAESPAAITVDDFINETARAMGQSGIPQLTGDAKRSALLEALRPMRTLLIYDNLETLTKEGQEATADFLRFLPHGCKAIMTSRRRGGEGAVWLRLEKLDWQTARQIIEHESDKDERLAQTLQRAGEARCKELYDETGGSPLALLWTLGLMRARALTFDRALEMLRRGASRESDLQQFIYAEARKQLSANEVAALNALSFFVPSASFEALIAVTTLTRTALERVLERLSALALVDEQAGEERYALHPLTRRFVRDDLLADVETARATGRRFARYWVDYAKRYGGDSQENYKTYDHLEAEWTNLNAAASWLWETAAVQDDRAVDEEAARMFVDLVDALFQFLYFNGRWDDMIHLDARAYEAARALRDWSSAGWCAGRVAWFYYQRARTNDAALWIDRSAEALNHTGNKHEQAVAMEMRGLIAGQREDYDEAKRLLLDALAIQRSLNQNVSIANLLLNLGMIARLCKEYDTAEQYYHEALELGQKQNARHLIPAVLSDLGLLALERKQWSEARKWFQEALSLAREIGRVELIAYAQLGLAKIWEAEGQVDLALPLAQEALATFEKLQHTALGWARESVESITAAWQKSIHNT